MALYQGNILLSGGNNEAPDEIFVAQYNVTTFNEIQAARDSGKVICVEHEGAVGYLSVGSSSEFNFITLSSSGDLVKNYKINSDNQWSYSTPSQTAKKHGHTHGTDGTDPITLLSIGAAPINHASTDYSYGKANAEYFGHVKLYSKTDSISGDSAGVAATPYAVKLAYDKATAAQTTANEAKASAGYSKAETLADDTKALFGLGSGAVPNDLLGVLSKAALVQSVPKFTKHTIANPTYGKSVGDTVSLNVNGVATDFLVVHRGKPSNLYDDACNGCWLVMKDIYELSKWTTGSYGNDYANSTTHNYLNGTFLGKFDADVQWMVKQAKIPYVKGSASSTVASGAQGLSTKVFLLSAYEIGLTSSNFAAFLEDGAKLDYFVAGDTANGTNRAKRIANYQGNATGWWLRSAYKGNANLVHYINSAGAYQDAQGGQSTYGIRPAMILPLEQEIAYYADDNGNRYSEQEYETVLADALGEVVSNAVRVDVGKYIGTGTNGQSNPNVINFAFKPKLLIVRRNAPGATNGENGEALIMVTNIPQVYSGNSNYPINITWDGNSVSWWANNNANLQYNGSGGGYYYIAIG